MPEHQTRDEAQATKVAEQLEFLRVLLLIEVLVEALHIGRVGVVKGHVHVEIAVGRY
ncbi:hypothetical protein D3C71_2237370 [compost metagenome]